MSYILDALKKSEQERGHGSVPDVQTVHSSSLNYRNEKKAYWPYILIIAVLLNLAAIAYFIFDKNSPIEATQTSPGNISKIQTTADSVTQKQPVTPIPLASESIVETADKPNSGYANATTKQNPQEAVPPVPIQPTPTTREVPPTSSKTVTAVSRPQEVSSVSDGGIIDFHELPASIKQQLPAITISAHVYSSNPLQRSIVINNNFMEEGEYVLDDLVLYEITKDGAVFNYQGTLFNYGVVSGWQ